MASTGDIRPRVPTPQPMTSVVDETPTRRPYTGSCHCGKIKFVIYMTLPLQPPYIKPEPSKPALQFVRKCNCTVCHKAAYFHISLADTCNDFILLSPLDPLVELTNYQCVEKRQNLLFCPTCGIRAFIAETPVGEPMGEITSQDLSILGLSQSQLKRLGFENEDDAKAVRVNIPGTGWKDGTTHFLRVNAHALDADQKGLDLREWHERKWVQYVNWFDEVDGARSYERPFHFGAY
jgi:hypothetical protein